MDWKNKIDIVSACIETNEDIESDFYIKENGVSTEFMSKLRNEYPFITEDYIRFLEMTDGADIAQCIIAGTSNLYELIESHLDIYPKENWLPIGWEAGGDPILLNRSGQIGLGAAKSSQSDFALLANSFSEFINEVLMGPKYASIFRVEESDYLCFYEEEINDDPWLEFLVQQQWVQI